MKAKSCVFNPEKDLKEVEPFGYIDLKQAFETSTVPSQLPDSDVDYNGIEEPESILGKPRDVFDAMHMEAAINNYGKEPSDTSKKDE